MPKYTAYQNTVGEGYSSPATVNVRKAFARRLQMLLDDRGWNQSDLARAAAEHVPERKFGRDNVSSYIRGISLPGPVYLTAMAKALGVEKSDLIPPEGVRSVDNVFPDVEVKDLGEGEAHLKINQAVPWPVALEIMAMLKKNNAASE